MTRLRERCERAIEDPPTASNHKKHLVDFHFYLGLANGDVEKMESSLGEVTSPRALSGRRNEESGYTESLISTPAMIYAKLAARLGYQLKINSSYVPPEWLPVARLGHFQSPYSFLSG
ncbi:Imm49 family immunity protein [Paraburkholderia sediminicola]|uniref:Imm49 family immunity protein n=1 Tax=Paraburkholderia sediminicola TaxID=458836 RepID=UPI0038BB8F73